MSINIRRFVKTWISTTCLTAKSVLLLFSPLDHKCCFHFVISCVSLLMCSPEKLVNCEKNHNNHSWKYFNQKNVCLLLTRHPGSDRKAQSLLRGTPLTRPPSALPSSGLSDSVGIDRSGWEGMSLYKVFSGRRTRVTVGRKIRDTQLERDGPWADNVALIWMTRSAHQPSNQPGLGGVGVEWRGSWGGERKEKGESERNEKRQRGEEGEGRQGCPSFKTAGLNGTDISDI